MLCPDYGYIKELIQKVERTPGMSSSGTQSSSVSPSPGPPAVPRASPSPDHLELGHCREEAARRKTLPREIPSEWAPPGQAGVPTHPKRPASPTRGQGPAFPLSGPLTAPPPLPIPGPLTRSLSGTLTHAGPSRTPLAPLTRSLSESFALPRPPHTEPPSLTAPSQGAFHPHGPFILPGLSHGALLPHGPLTHPGPPHSPRPLTRSLLGAPHTEPSTLTAPS